jgi:hypothetical protein
MDTTGICGFFSSGIKRPRYKAEHSRGKECVALYLRSHVHIHNVVLYLPQRQISLYLYHLFSFCLLFFRPPLWSSGQSSWLQIQRSGVDSRRY